MRSVGGANHCQGRLEGFRRAGLNCATVEIVPGNYSPWKERSFILFSVTAWDCKAAAVVSGLFMDRTGFWPV